MFKSLKNKWQSLATIDRLVTIFLLIGLCGVTGCILWDTTREYPYDNFIEERIEDILRNKYPWDLDLTPDSSEKSLYKKQTP